MSIHAQYPHIDSPPNQPARLNRLPRIRVAQIAMDYLAHGWSADEMCRQHPALRPAEVHAAMAYYFDHREQIDLEIQQEFATATNEGQQTAPSAVVMRLKAQGKL